MFGKTLSGRKLPAPTATTAPTSFEFAILKGLQNRRLYQGTVPEGTKAIRRARGKVAKVSRKANRGNR